MGVFTPGTATNRAGFAGYEHGSVRATVYRHGDLLLQVASSPIDLDGVRESDARPCITAASVQNAMGQGGSFQLTLKAAATFDLLSFVTSDDWVDIEFGRNGVFWHVLRGLVDEVRCATDVAGGGVTSMTYLIAGQSFQKVWHNTPMWFSAIRAENVYGGAQLQAEEGVGRDVPGTVASFLFDYTNRVAQRSRTSIALPPQLPGGAKDFSDAWRQDETQFYGDDCPRVNFLRNLFFPNQSVWEVAASWADPYFCEMFTDILPAVPDVTSSRPKDRTGRSQKVTSIFSMQPMVTDGEVLPEGLSPLQSRMTLVMRNKPFIGVSAMSGDRLLRNSPWFSLPMYSVPSQHLSLTDLGRSDYERVNAFLCSQQIGEGGPSLGDIALPLFNEADIARHGYRPIDTITRYSPDTTGVSTKTRGIDGVTMSRRLRSRLRDWYMFNAHYLQGTVTFGRGYPELRIGTRLRLIGATEVTQKTFYIETVAHQYQPMMGVRTTCGVTRGYIGRDEDHLAQLQQMAAQFTAPEG